MLSSQRCIYLWYKYELKWLQDKEHQQDIVIQHFLTLTIYHRLVYLIVYLTNTSSSLSIYVSYSFISFSFIFYPFSFRWKEHSYHTSIDTTNFWWIRLFFGINYRGHTSNKYLLKTNSKLRAYTEQNIYNQPS